jgi:hypothetical protein
MTRSRVSAAIGTRVGASLSTLDTVLCDTPAALAMSRMVVTARMCRSSGIGADVRSDLSSTTPLQVRSRES